MAKHLHKGDESRQRWKIIDASCGRCAKLGVSSFFSNKMNAG